MTWQTVPTYDDPHWSEVVNLDGVPFLLTLDFAARSSTWRLTIATAEGVPIRAGIKLVCLWDLLDGVVDPRRPPGKLMVIPNSADLSPPGLEDLVAGGRCELVYMPAADLAGAG